MQRSTFVSRRRGVSDRGWTGVLIIGILAGFGLFTFVVERTAIPQCLGFCGTAQITVSVTDCRSSASGQVCFLSATNTGNSDVFATGCGWQLEGQSVRGDLNGTVFFRAGSYNDTLTCTAQGPQPHSGASVTGFLLLSNGGQAVFAGTWP